ncbi:hypothetical protein B0H13DRAFT_2299900 [Mycena leptocephala]|nr:hypothetical protein B0H13DRAFT_2299900 [Mycena leptocephala]
MRCVTPPSKQRSETLFHTRAEDAPSSPALFFIDSPSILLILVYCYWVQWAITLLVLDKSLGVWVFRLFLDN